MPFEFGDVVLVPFPFIDQSASKKRPAVVVSSRAYNAAKPDIILLAITSQIRPAAAPGEIWIHDWKEAGLLKASVVKPVFATLEQALVVRRLGALCDSDKEALRQVIAQTLQWAATYWAGVPDAVSFETEFDHPLHWIIPRTTCARLEGEPNRRRPAQSLAPARFGKRPRIDFARSLLFSLHQGNRSCFGRPAIRSCDRLSP